MVARTLGLDKVQMLGDVSVVRTRLLLRRGHPQVARAVFELQPPVRAVVGELWGQIAGVALRFLVCRAALDTTYARYWAGTVAEIICDAAFVNELPLQTAFDVTPGSTPDAVVLTRDCVGVDNNGDDNGDVTVFGGTAASANGSATVASTTVPASPSLPAVEPNE